MVVPVVVECPRKLETSSVLELTALCRCGWMDVLPQGNLKRHRGVSVLSPSPP